MSAATGIAQQDQKQLKVAWISDYPVEWIEDAPKPLRDLQRQHPATWAMGLLEELKRRDDVTLHVIVLRSKVEKDLHFERDGIHYHVLKASRLLRLLTLFWDDTWTIRKQLRAIQADLVHAWGVERGAALVASRLKVPSVVTIQGILSWYCSVVPKVHPFVRLAAMLEPLSLRRARWITAESSFASSYLSKRYSTARVYHVDYAPRQVFFKVTRAPQLCPTRMISVGSIGFGKGTDLLLKALDPLTKDYEFEVLLISAPKPSYLQELRTSISEATWERIQVKSHLTSEQVADELSLATFMVLPTRVDTGPTAVKEAAVAGVPVIGTQVGGMADYIRPGVNGLLCPANDLAALTTSIREALNHPLFAQGQVQPGSRETAQGYLSPAVMAHGFMNAYLDVASNKHADVVS